MGNYYDGITMVGIFGDKGSALGIRSLLFFLFVFHDWVFGIYRDSGTGTWPSANYLGGTCITMFFGIGCLFVLSGSPDAGNKKWPCDLRCPLFIIIITR